MPADYLDRYGRGQSLCHRLPDRLKVLLTFTVALIAVSIPPRYWPVQGVLGVLIFTGHTLAGIPLAYLARRLAVFLPMVLALSISFPLSAGFREGWEVMAAILVRSTLAFLAVLWVVNVMPFNHLLITLRQLYVPAVLVAMLSFMYRYIFVLWDELEKMRAARRARTFHPRPLLTRWKDNAQLIGMLLIRGMGRAERVHDAMCARGWDGEVRSLD